MSKNIPTIIPQNIKNELESTEQTINQTGEKNIFASKIENMNVNLQINSNDFTPQLLKQIKPPEPIQVDTTYYNLFVINEVDFTKSESFIIDSSRALTDYVNMDINTEFSSLSDTAIEKIKTFPSIFANENRHYGHTDEEQVFGYGFVEQIKVRKIGVKIKPSIIYLIPQQRLNEALFELDLYGSGALNELNRTHWAIKKVNLIEELQELGFNI